MRSYNERNLIDQIKKNGIPYLIGDSSEYTVLFTKEGLKKYNQILFMHPTAVSAKQDDSGKTIMTLTAPMSKW